VTGGEMIVSEYIEEPEPVKTMHTATGTTVVP